MEHIDWLDNGNVDYGFSYPGWYFWDETGAYCHGPYTSPALALEKLVQYCYELGKME